VECGIREEEFKFESANFKWEAGGEKGKKEAG